MCVPPLVCGRATPAAGVLSQHLFWVLGEGESNAQGKAYRNTHQHGDTANWVSHGMENRRGLLRCCSAWAISPDVISRGSHQGISVENSVVLCKHVSSDLPASSVKVIYCPKKPSRCVRPGRQRATAEGSVCSATGQPVSVVGCWVISAVTRWIISSPLLIPGLGLTGHKLQLLVRFRAETRSSTARSV